MRLGYFGGSFDPPHLGHLAVARAAADAFALDRVLLVPTASQPLKPAGAHAPYADRLAMVELLCAADPRLQACDLEQPNGGAAAMPNYTVDSLRRLHRDEPDAALYVIVGADAFLELPRWRAPVELLSLAEWIVVTRPSLSGAGELRLPPLTATQCARVHPLTSVDEPASATAVRAELARGDCAGSLPPDILAYIRSHGLYAGS